MALATFILGAYDRFAGNLAMGGLGAQTSPVGQEELVHRELPRNVADMRMSVVSFASDCILDLGRLMWEDQTLELQSSIPVGNSGIEVSSDWTPDYRVGAFEDYQFRVEPYSMVFKTPEHELTQLFDAMPALYIADGHHRSASASRVAAALRSRATRPTGEESWEYFLCVAFPHDEMKILDYNRVVRDLNGHDAAKFLARIGERFTVTQSQGQARPGRPGEFGMYLAGRWYRLTIRPELVPADPVAGLDVSLLHLGNFVLVLVDALGFGETLFYG